MTYKEIMVEVIKTTGKQVKECWIAEVKEHHVLTKWPAPNRGKCKGAPPCPQCAWTEIEQVLKKNGIIK